jgi:MADS-box transcription enhancer factor 2B
VGCVDDDVAGGHAAAADAWRQAYTCPELLSPLIPTTPFPLMPVSCCPRPPSSP